MKKNLFVVIALVGALFVPTMARAHDNDKTVMGSVSSIKGNNLMIKTTDDKSVMVMMDTKTKITKGTAKLKAADLKVGDGVLPAVIRLAAAARRRHGLCGHHARAPLEDALPERPADHPVALQGDRAPAQPTQRWTNRRKSYCI
jgi:hypothetical protein